MMKVENIETYRIAIPLKRAFKTALRTVTTAESIIVKVTCTNGVVGWGEAPPTHVITGDSLASLDYVINDIFKPLLVNQAVLQRELIFEKIHTAIIGNTSAKAAIDMALHDCIAQHAGMPLSQFLGGYKETIETDYTVSVNSPLEMAMDAQSYLDAGFTTLKVKVGKDQIAMDVQRIEAIRKQVGDSPLIRLDANQGWQAKEAVQAINQMEALDLNIELIEQPVKAHDLEALKYVTDHTATPIMADESVFSAHDAKQVLAMGAADLLNIKLMKAGGIHEAMKIAKLAAVYDVECMVGSMIETKLGITAAAHFAASQPNITRFDFDAPLMLADDLIEGGITYKHSSIDLGKNAGLGIKAIDTAFIVDSTNH